MPLPKAAGVLKISRQVAHRHAKTLVESGALRQLSMPRAPLVCERGPRSVEFERSSASPSDRGGRSWPGVRAHHWRWSWRVDSGPRVEPIWLGRSTASRVESCWRVEDVDGEPWTVRLYRGPRKSRLEIAPAPVYCFSGEQVATAEDARRREVAAFARSWARRYGVTLDGELSQNHPTEWATPPVPGLEPVGVPGVDRIHADESPGAGLVEMETRERPLAMAWADLPAFEADLLRRVAEVEAAHMRGLALTERILRIIEKDKEKAT